MALPSILTPEKIQQFDNPPKFKPHERLLHFRSDDFVIKVLPSLKTPINKVGFLLQYTYFKVTHKFFSAKKFRKIDINHACRALEIKPSPIDFKDYSSRVFSHHKTLILKHMRIAR